MLMKLLDVRKVKQENNFNEINNLAHFLIYKKLQCTKSTISAFYKFQNAQYNQFQ